MWNILVLFTERNIVLQSSIYLEHYSSLIGNSGRSDFKDIIRNSIGGWMTGFVDRYNHTTNINIKFRVIFYVLQITWNLSFRDIICELYSQTTLIYVVLTTHSYAPFITYILFMLRLKYCVGLYIMRRKLLCRLTC